MPQQYRVSNPVGIYRDFPDRDLPPEKWTDGANVQFINGKTVKRKGQAEVFFTFTSSNDTPSPARTGQGTIASIEFGPSTVAETWTIQCTDVTTPGSEVWSITGSVTGALTDTATTGTAFASPYISFTISRDATSPITDFIVGDKFLITFTRVSPADEVHWMIPWDTPSADYWVWTSLTDAYLWTGTAHTNITRGSGSPSQDYNADADILWTGCIYGDVVIANNGVDIPQYMGTGSLKFEDFPTELNTSPADSSQWPSNLRCKSLRAFKQYLIAMNLTVGSTDKPQNVRWSTAADPGSVPQWDISDATLEAGETVLSETDGAVIDGLALGDSFIIYKSDAVWGMQLIGGQYVMRFYKIFTDVGLLNTNCVASFEGKHFCVGVNDVYVHNGTSKQSVISDKVRNGLFQRINDTYINRSYCVADHRNREVLFCYVKSGGSATYPNEAMVWNWESNECSFRDLPGSAHIAYGEVLDAPKETDTWDASVATWDQSLQEWGEVVGKPTERRLVIPNTTSQTFYAEGRDTTDGGTAFRAFVERTGLDFDQPDIYKHCYRIWPVIKGSGTVSFYIGGEDAPYGGIRWYGPVAYEIGVDKKVDCAVAGKALALRIESTNNTGWEIAGYSMELELGGRF